MAPVRSAGQRYQVGFRFRLNLESSIRFCTVLLYVMQYRAPVGIGRSRGFSGTRTVKFAADMTGRTLDYVYFYRLASSRTV